MQKREQQSRRRSPSPGRPQPVIAIFRVKLQSLARFTRYNSKARFPGGKDNYYFQFHLTEEATNSPDAMVDALQTQYEESSAVRLQFSDMAKHRWLLVASAVGKETTLLDLHDIDDFAGVLTWVKAHRGDWNRLMEIG